MLDAATVTLSESEIKRCEKLVAEFIERRRPPPRLRKDVDLAFRMKGQSIEIFELRAHWSGSGKPVEHGAQATFGPAPSNLSAPWVILPPIKRGCIVNSFSNFSSQLRHSGPAPS